MATAEIRAGICGFTTTVEARTVGTVCELSIASDCSAIQRLAAELKEVDPLREISFRGEGPQVLRAAAATCRHPGCPVPVGIIKAVEVEAGLALPADVAITVSK